MSSLDRIVAFYASMLLRLWAVNGRRKMYCSRQGFRVSRRQDSVLWFIFFRSSAPAVRINLCLIVEFKAQSWCSGLASTVASFKLDDDDHYNLLYACTCNYKQARVVRQYEVEINTIIFFNSFNWWLEGGIVPDSVWVPHSMNRQSVWFIRFRWLRLWLKSDCPWSARLPRLDLSPSSKTETRTLPPKRTLRIRTFGCCWIGKKRIAAAVATQKPCLYYS